MKVRAISYLAATAALLGNPLFACDDPVDYLITRAEVENALQGEWTVMADGHTSRFAIDFGQARHASRGLISSASACSHRSWVSSAEACLDVTEVRLKLLALEGELPENAELEIHEARFERGWLRFQFAGRYVNAHILRDGRVESVDDGVTLEHDRSPPR